MPDTSQYGFVASLAAAVPELDALLTRASEEGWDPGTFELRLQDTAWWKTQWPTVKQALTLKTTDPAQWSQKLSQTLDVVQRMAIEAGVMHAGVNWAPVAEQALTLGWSEAQIKARIGQFWLAGASPDIASGTAAQYEMKLKQMNQQYGTGINQAGINWQISQLISGANTLATYENFYKRRAKEMYPGLWQELDAGLTVAEVAAPYRTAMAQILEIPETEITLDDPHLKRALQFRDDKGQASVKPLWQYQQDLKNDVRWTYTQNARDTAYDMATQIGQDFGFLKA